MRYVEPRDMSQGCTWENVDRYGLTEFIAEMSYVDRQGVHAHDDSRRWECRNGHGRGSDVGGLHRYELRGWSNETVRWFMMMHRCDECGIPVCRGCVQIYELIQKMPCHCQGCVMSMPESVRSVLAVSRTADDIVMAFGKWMRQAEVDSLYETMVSESTRSVNL